jgi:hypothetical protein
MREWAEEYNFPCEWVADATAVASPQVRWTQQVSTQMPTLLWAAQHGLSFDNPAGYMHNNSKAYGILLGEEGLVTGPKVSNFAANLRGCDESVTIDTWMVRALQGHGAPLSPRGKRYSTLARAVACAAVLFGLAPAEGQSIIWHQVQIES